MPNRWTKPDWTVLAVITAPAIGCLALLGIAAIQWQIRAAQVARAANDIYHHPDVERVRAKQVKQVRQHQLTPASHPGNVPFKIRWKRDTTNTAVITTAPELHLQYRHAMEQFSSEYHPKDRWFGYIYGNSQVKQELKDYIAKLGALPSDQSTGRPDSILQHPLARLDPELLCIECMDRGNVKQAIELATSDHLVINGTIQVPLDLIRKMLKINQWTPEDLDVLESKLLDTNFLKTAVVCAMALDRADHRTLEHYGKSLSYGDSNQLIERLPTAPSIRLTALEALKAELDKPESDSARTHALAALQRLDVVLGLNLARIGGAKPIYRDHFRRLRDGLLRMIAIRRGQLRSGKSGTREPQLGSARRAEFRLVMSRDRLGNSQDQAVILCGVDYSPLLLVDEVIESTERKP